MRPPDALRCVAVARWSGNGKQRCRKRAAGPDGLCTMHRRFPPRSAKPETSLLAELASFELDEGKEIRVQLRRGDDGNSFLVVRLFLGDVPTRRALYLSPGDLDGFALALSDAAERLEGCAW